MIAEQLNASPIKSIIIIGAILRIAVILTASQYEDILGHQLKLTDIDYKVYTDAAMAQNPYYRHTYRYTPILAYFMKFNDTAQYAGKIVFVIFDVIAMLALAKIMKSQYRSMIIKLYSYNPLFIILTARGSCQSITLALMFWTFYFIFGNNGNSILNHQMNQKVKIQKDSRLYTSFGYLLYGLWVHFRVYPIIFLPVILLHQHAISKRTKNSFLFVFIKIAIISGGTFLGLLGIFYYMYGYIFIQQTYLYHLTRLDNRHSFSPIFYEIYLTMSAQSSLRSLAQITILITVSRKVHSSISPIYSIFLITYAFVNFNKVITMQYYMWIWGSLLLLLPQSNLMTNSQRRYQKSFNYTMQWVLGVAVWVWFSSKLQVHGQDVYLGMWVLNICKLFLDIWVVLGFLSTIKNVHGYQSLPQN